jgi:WD40 repeat protein
MRITTLDKKADAHEEGIWSAVWVPNSHRLLTGSVDETIKVWDASDEKLQFVHTLSGFSLGVISLAVDALGSYGAASALDSNIRMWDLSTYETKHIYDLPPTELWCIAAGPSSDGSTTLAAAGGSTHKVLVYTSSADDEGGQTKQYDLPPVGVLAVLLSKLLV